MSIVACVKVQDGLVLGCDSTTQISGRDPAGNVGVLKVYQNAEKLFKIEGLPVGILTYGTGNIGPKSIRTIIREFEKNKSYADDKEYGIEDISNELLNYLINI